VWCFLGDGEMDEPESLGAIGLAAREGLDNLVFVVNCNLQRLDGPVRGNGKIIQELESIFRGAGWNVIKVIWGRQWDELLARDSHGLLLHQMNTTPDGQFQTYSVEDGAYTRQRFFGTDDRLLAMVEHLSDDDIRRLPRGGHDFRKVYAAFHAAFHATGSPTVILAHSVKGWKLGEAFEGRNATHQMKKLATADLKVMRDRLHIPVPDAQLDEGLPPYYHPGPDSDEVRYLQNRRRVLGGPLPERRVTAKPLPLPAPDMYADLKKGSGKQPMATTMAFVRLLKDLAKDQGVGRRIVPIIPDEARTFGLDAMFPTAKIYNPYGQRYDSVDRSLLLSYQESVTGQILHEGINEAGSMASLIAAGSSYATHGEPMIGVYIFYSMFGFQRTGDQFWQMADQLARGFVVGATAGRTTLNGEGLQHQDGHSLLLASTNPAVVAYDPAYAYELAIIVEDGLRRMYGDHAEDVIYYLTVYNEPYPQPPAPPSPTVEEGVLRGMYLLSPSGASGPRAQILASGIAVRLAREAQDLLEREWGVAADVWSVTSWNELRRQALAVEECALFDSGAVSEPWLTTQLAASSGPVIAVSDWMRAVPDQIARWVPRPWLSLGTDGFGHSDTRTALRRHFRIDAESITVGVLRSLEREAALPAGTAQAAIDRYGLSTRG